MKDNVLHNTIQTEIVRWSCDRTRMKYTKMAVLVVIALNPHWLRQSFASRNRSEETFKAATPSSSLVVSDTCFLFKEWEGTCDTPLSEKTMICGTRDAELVGCLTGKLHSILSGRNNVWINICTFVAPQNVFNFTTTDTCHVNEELGTVNCQGRRPFNAVCVFYLFPYSIQGLPAEKAETLSRWHTRLREGHKCKLRVLNKVK